MDRLNPRQTQFPQREVSQGKGDLEEVGTLEPLRGEQKLGDGNEVRIQNITEMLQSGNLATQQASLCPPSLESWLDHHLGKMLAL